MHYGPWSRLSTGLHQWAITLGPEDHLVVENFQTSHDLTKLLQDVALVTAWREDLYIIANITKVATKPRALMREHSTAPPI